MGTLGAVVLGSVVLALVVAIAAYALLWVLVARAAYRMTLSHLALKPGLKVADVGCGSGNLTLPIAARVGPAGLVIGLDPNPKRLHAAEQRVRAAELHNVRLLVAAAGEGVLKREHGASFDRALLVTVLGEMAEREPALTEVFRTLKPGGRLVVTEARLDPHYQDRQTVRALAAATGFVEEGYAGSGWLFTMAFVKPLELDDIGSAG